MREAAATAEKESRYRAHTNKQETGALLALRIYDKEVQNKLSRTREYRTPDIRPRNGTLYKLLLHSYFAMLAYFTQNW